jgi:hypothetical protein
MNDTQLRFLREIAERVPLDRVTEVHLFRARRQGAMETGVAVVAARVEGEDEQRSRQTVYTARYRHVLKGPERGDWEADVVAEADAPLVTVDEVVRGVQKRSGDVDEADPDRITGEKLRELVDQAAEPAES